MPTDEKMPKRPANVGELWQAHSAVNNIQQHGRELTTTNEVVDGLLQGGISYGSQVCISAVDVEEASHIGNLLIVSHLRKTQDARVTILDTTNSFDVRALAQVVKQRLSEEDVLTMLERVSIVRTFDSHGWSESIDKIRAELQSGSLPREHLLVIDRLSSNARILLKNNPVQGQGVLDAFFRTLKSLSSDHGVCCVLVEGFVQSRDSKADMDCLMSTTDMQPFFNESTAPGIDLHIHIHDVSSTPGTQQRTDLPERRVVLEIAASRHDDRGRQWLHCDASQLRL